MVKIGINGFGRIGRSVFRASLLDPAVEIVCINDLMEPKTLAYLLKYDSLMGVFPEEVDYGEHSLIVGGRTIAITAERNPADINWKSWGAELVIEATGLFTSRDQAAVHITSGGAKRVIISAPGKGDDMTIVMGVNHRGYDPQKHYIVSNGSCTTNALAPVAMVLNDSFTIEHGLMMTTHAYTNSQSLHDEPGKEMRTARAAALSIIPHSTGAARAIGRVIPSLEGKLSGFSLRVPVPVVSIVDLTVTLSQSVTLVEVNEALKKASQTDLKGILGYSEEPLVSADYRGDSRSSIVDALTTSVIGEKMVKVMSWYDNEWAFSCRLVELAAYLNERGL